MNFARFLQIVATISAVVAVTLGIGTFSSSDYTTAHIVFGSLVTLALLIMSIMTVATRGLRRLGVIGIVYALVLPIFGSTQQMIWVGNQHWLIQALHLMVSFGSIPFIDNLRARYTVSRKPVPTQLTGQLQPVQ
jgi:hypothetical protein